MIAENDDYLWVRVKTKQISNLMLPCSLAHSFCSFSLCVSLDESFSRKKQFKWSNERIRELHIGRAWFSPVTLFAVYMWIEWNFMKIFISSHTHMWHTSKTRYNDSRAVVVFGSSSFFKRNCHNFTRIPCTHRIIHNNNM